MSEVRAESWFTQAPVNKPAKNESIAEHCLTAAAIAVVHVSLDGAIRVVDKYDDDALANLQSYKASSGMPRSKVISEVQPYLFYH